MMTETQIEYELRHFRNAPRSENDRRQQWILEKWKFGGIPGGTVIEIGCGPHGGCLPLIEAAIKIAVDPLLPEYEKLGFLSGWPGSIVGVKAYVEDLPNEAVPAGIADALLCYNVLEHGDSGFDAIDQISALLSPAGTFYLQQALRDESQLNEAHTHVMTMEDLRVAIDRNALDIVRQWIEPVQPGFDYPMAMGIYRKP